MESICQMMNGLKGAMFPALNEIIGYMNHQEGSFLHPGNGIRQQKQFRGLSDTEYQRFQAVSEEAGRSL